MKLSDIFEQEIRTQGKPIADTHDKESPTYKSEQYFFAVRAFKEFKKNGSDPSSIEKTRAKYCKDPRCAKAFDLMIQNNKHYLSDTERAKVGL